jgi:hypothetical protein
MVAIAEEM